MLFYIRCTALNVGARSRSGPQMNIPIEMLPSQTVAELRKALLIKFPNLVIRRIIFSGKLLSDDQAQICMLRY